MTVKTMNRSRRAVYLVVLLAIAVALTTALVLAGERKPERSKTITPQPITVHTFGAGCVWGKRNV